MTLKTRKIRITVTAPDGAPVPYAGIQATLTAYEIDGMLVVPTVVRGQTDATGSALIELWPNSRGTAGSQYNITAAKNGTLLLNVMATVPDGDAATEVLLQTIITPVAPPPVDAAQLAVIQAQALVDQATTQADASGANAALTAADVASTHADASAAHADALLANADATATAADRVQTGLDAAATAADRIQTAADRAQTTADAAATAADRVQTGLDKTATAADRVQTGLDKTATAADRMQTGLDKTATAADRVQTGLDKTATATDVSSTHADVVLTNSDASATAADRVQTGLDKSATAADRVQTGMDKTATAADRVQTGLDKTAATTQATNAATTYTNFDKRYLGAKATAPTLDNQGAALAAGALYWDTVLNLMRVYTGSAWDATTEADARMLADQAMLEAVAYLNSLLGVDILELARYKGVTDTRLVAIEPGMDVTAQSFMWGMDALGAAARSVTDRAKLVAAPASASSAGTKGEFAYDASYIYVCTALNTWKRVAIATW